MNIHEITFVGVAGYLQKISDYPNIAWIYRGQADKSWKLIPSAGRPEYFPQKQDGNNDLPPRDICRFNYWRKLAVAYNKNLSENDFECLAYAQHYGLATRLLDWSTNPLVALFFAVDSCLDIDGYVYCYSADKFIDPDKAELGYMPYTCQYIPTPIDNRVLMQSGVFTYHPLPNESLVAENVSNELGAIKPTHGKNLVRLLVESKFKKIFKRQLDEIGINRKTLFPDLDGLSNYVNWGTNRSINKNA